MVFGMTGECKDYKGDDKATNTTDRQERKLYCMSYVHEFRDERGRLPGIVDRR